MCAQLYIVLMALLHCTLFSQVSPGILSSTVADFQIIKPSPPPISDNQLVRQFVNSVLNKQNVSLAHVPPSGLTTMSSELEPTTTIVHDSGITNKRNARQDSELLKQIKMQFVLDCELLDKHGGPAPVSHQSAVYNLVTRAPVTLPYVPSTTTMPSFKPPQQTVNQEDVDDDDDDAAPFEAVQDVVGSMYGMVEQSFDGSDSDNVDNESGDDDSDEDGELAVESQVQIVHTEPTPHGTTRRLPQQQQLHYQMPVQTHQQQPSFSQPTIIYALPQSIPAGYFQEDDGHRNKRTTLSPYGNYYHPGGYVKGPEHQFITGNVADAGLLDPNRNGYFSTQFHVTSAYSPPPSAESLRKKDNRADSSEEGDEYGFYDAVDLSGLNVEPEGDDDDDESESRSDESSDSDDDDEDDDEGNSFPTGVNRINRQKDKMRVPRIPMRPDYGSYDSSDDVDEDDDENDSVEKSNTPSNFFENIFGHFFQPISWMWPSAKASSSLWSPFRMFGSRRVNTVSSKSARGKTLSRRSSNHRRSAKKPMQHKNDDVVMKDTDVDVLQLGNGIESGPDVQAFFDSVQTSAEHTEDAFATIPADPMPAHQSSEEEALTGFWSWWYGTNSADSIETEAEMITTTVTVPTIDANPDDASGWNIFSMFGSTTSESPPVTLAPTVVATTTRRPFMSIANPLQNPAAWLGILAQHLASSPATFPAQPHLEMSAKLKRVNYANWQLWRLRPTNAEAVAFLKQYRRSEAGALLSWWRGPSKKGSTDIAVPPAQQDDLRDTLADEEIAYEIIMWDLDKAILYSNPDESRIERAANVARNGHPLTWHRYHRYADIVRFMEYLQRNHSEMVELMHIGRSFEGRPLTVVRIATEDRVNQEWKRSGQSKRDKRFKGQHRHRWRGTTKQPPKPSVFIEAGSHAREWIGPASATWFLRRLVERIGGNDTLGETLRMVDWYVMPMLNPDGYEHSHIYDRFWRKTRSKHAPKGANSLFAIAMNWIKQQPDTENDEKSANCLGTDPNRNWNYEWNRATSTEAEEVNGIAEQTAFQTDCSEFYPGPHAFSEPETRAVSAFLKENRKHIKMFISLHGYGQTISYPAAKNATKTDNNISNSSKGDDVLYDMAHVALVAMRSSLQKTNTGSSVSSASKEENLTSMMSAQKYTIDSGGEMMADRRRAGRADAYAMNGEPHIKYAYTLDLRDSGTHGFLLPPSNIAAVGREVFEFVRGMVDYM